MAVNVLSGGVSGLINRQTIVVEAASFGVMRQPVRRKFQNPRSWIRKNWASNSLK
jgi:hypothetical protein